MNNESRGKLLALIRCCLCIGGSFGIVSNCMGIFFSPISQDLQVGIGSVSVMVTFIGIAGAFFAPLFGRLTKTKPLNLLMSAGVVLTIAAVFFVSAASAVWQLCLGGVLIGIGIQCFAAIPVTMVLRDWYREKNGGVIGIAMGLSGVAGMFMNPVFSRLITMFGWRIAYRILALILAVLILPCTLTMKMNPAPKTDTEGAAAAGSTVVPGTMKMMLFAAVIFVSMLVSMNPHLSAYAIDRGYTLENSAMVLSAAMLANVSFKLLHGFLADHMDPIISTMLMAMTGCAGTVILLLFAGTRVMMLGGAFLYGAYFTVTTVGLTQLTQIVAKDQYTSVYSVVVMLNSIFYSLSVSLNGILYDRTGAYQVVLLMIVAYAVLALLLMTRIRSKSAAAERL